MYDAQRSSISLSVFTATIAGFSYCSQYHCRSSPSTITSYTILLISKQTVQNQFWHFSQFINLSSLLINILEHLPHVMEFSFSLLTDGLLCGFFPLPLLFGEYSHRTRFSGYLPFVLSGILVNAKTGSGVHFNWHRFGSLWIYAADKFFADIEQ
jgi:hypothetical protein